MLMRLLLKMKLFTASIFTVGIPEIWEKSQRTWIDQKKRQDIIDALALIATIPTV